MKNYVITIARGYGSGGTHIARQLSKELGIACYDREILKMASDLSGIAEFFFLETNEKVRTGQLAFPVRKKTHSWEILPPSDKRYLSSNNLFAYQAKVIQDLAQEGKPSCIIVGKAANYILRSCPNILALNIQAPMSTAVNNIMTRLVTDEKNALKTIEQTNRQRSNYYKYYTGGEWLDPREYDLSINPELISEAETVKIIRLILQERFPEAFC